MANPGAKDPEHEFVIEELRQPVLVYLRDNMDEFLKYLREAKPDVETILYSTGMPTYVDKLLNIVDPGREVFQHILYQNACYVFEKKDEDIHMLLKDISRFKNRDMKRSVLADPKPINFLMTPENGMPVVPYTAEQHNPN